jgi:uncharacterized UBP type Zn finger protein
VTAGAERAVAEDETSIAALMQHVLADYHVDVATIDESSREVQPMSTDPTMQAVALQPSAATKCEHAVGLGEIVPSGAGCEECLNMGSTWVHLRVCMVCGHVGCCDSSRNKHATAHFHASGHPVMRSLEPGEEWGWCYVDKVVL